MKRSIVTAATAALILVAAIARADTPEEREARILFKDGNRLVQAGDYTGALDKFRAAYSRYPSPKILLNIATSLELLGRRAEAADTFARYLADTESDPDRREQVEAALTALEAQIGRLRIGVQPPGATVSVDGRDVGEVEVEPLVIRVEPGGHSVVAVKPGVPPAVATVDVAGGQQIDVALRLAPAAPPPDTAPPTEPRLTGAPPPVERPAAVTDRAPAGPRHPGRPLQIAGLATAGVGLAALATGIGFGLSASAIEGEVEAAVRDNQPWTEELAARYDQGQRAHRLSRWTLAGGAAAVAGGGVLFYLGTRRNRHGEVARHAVAPVVSGSALGLAVELRY